MAIALITLNQILFGKPITNVVCFDNIQQDPTWLQDFADQFREAANDNWDNLMVTNWSLEDLTFSFIEGDHITHSVTVEFTDGNLVGNDILDGMPGGSTALISTSFTGPRPNRGRVYFSGAGEGSQSDGTWSNSLMSQLKSLVEAWAVGFQVEGSNSSLQICHRPSGPSDDYFANPVQLVNRRDNTTSQRRRNLG